MNTAIRPPKPKKYMTAQEERQLILRGQHGDVEARNKVIMNAYFLIIRKIGKKKAKLGQEFDDALNHVIGVLCAKFHKFDLRRNLRYTTYAMHWVRQATSQYIEGMNLIHIPSYHLRSNRIDKKRAEKRKMYVRNAMTISTLETTEKNDGLCQIHQSREPDPGSYLEHEDDLQLAQSLLRELTPKEQEVIQRRCQGDRLWQIGDDLDLTRERVRQIEYQAIRKLRNEVDPTIRDMRRIKRMIRQMAASNIPRKIIALRLRVDPSTVTRVMKQAV